MSPISIESVKYLFGNKTSLSSSSTKKAPGDWILSTLRVVSELWQFDDQKRNVLEIAKQSGLLYDKFEGFVTDLIKVGNNINSSQSSYQDAMNKLSEGKGNLVSKVENLKKLGAKTKKTLPQKLIDRSDQNNI